MGQTSILVVEDNMDIADAVQQFLSIQGYDVDRSQDGRAGLERAQTYHYDCIILDIMMPEMDGVQMLTQLRETKQTPVIMMTAKGELHDKRLGYEAGADDYIVKPFDLEELQMRIEAVISRTEVEDVIRWGDVEIFVDENMVHQSGKEISLTQTEFMILSTIALADGKTIQKATLIDEVRGGEALREQTGKLDVHIHHIRKKLGKGIIITVKGVGYKFPQV